ncbi:unnamed protein product [Durusdinium trenchii]|uniref:Uncharacterized protein n=1 Tax=Durusdinium trenchii TaxID=1381693 RepID=A0ABP0KTN1_9DINO
MDPAGSSDRRRGPRSGVFRGARPAPTARSWPVRLLGTWYLGGGKTQRVRRILRGTQTRQEDETEVVDERRRDDAGVGAGVGGQHRSFFFGEETRRSRRSAGVQDVQALQAKVGSNLQEQERALEELEALQAKVGSNLQGQERALEELEALQAKVGSNLQEQERALQELEAGLQADLHRAQIRELFSQRAVDICRENFAD